MASIKSNCRKVICIGRNYADHITELSSARPSQPFFFLKPSSSILPAHPSLNAKYGPCIRPRGVDLHYEVELGLTITSSPSGTPLKNLPDNPSVLELIDQYFISIDMTARNVQNEAKNKGLPWSIAKGFDTFLPISNPFPVAAIPSVSDPDKAPTLFLSVNGKDRQRDRTSLMLFQLPRLLSDISKVMTLEAGDVILTGTPKGVGSVKAGDVMRAGIELDGKEVEEGKIEIAVEDAEWGDGEEGYVFRET